MGTDKIFEMMTQDTGKHLLDSGMIYGYGYDDKNIATEPKAWQDGYEVVVRSTYHFLNDRLTFNNAEQEQFNDYVKQHCDDDMLWHDCIAQYIKQYEYEAKNVFNTYNSDNNLSRGFSAYVLENYNQDTVIVIQSHNGCDIRGGYSSPYFFTVKRDYDDVHIYDIDRGIIMYCNCSDFSVDDSDGWCDRDGNRITLTTDDNGYYLCPNCGNKLECDAM